MPRFVLTKAFFKKCVRNLLLRQPSLAKLAGTAVDVIERPLWLTQASYQRPLYVKDVNFLPGRIAEPLPVPLVANAPDCELWGKSLSWEAKPRFVATLAGCSVTINAVISPEMEVIWPLSHMWNIDPPDHPALAVPFLPRVQDLRGTALLLSVDSASNYFHWMLDLLLKLKVINDVGIRVEDFDHVIVNSCDKSFQRDSLAALGIAPEKTISSSVLRNVRPERLVCPSVADQSGFFHREDVVWLRKGLIGRDGIVGGATKQRIFIDRSATTGRRIVNQAEVSGVLERFGIISVQLEQLSFKNQIELFSEASLIIGAHGAGLTNLLFCESGTQIIELLNPNYCPQMYYGLSVACGLSYTGIVCRPSVNVAPVFQDMFVDIDQFKAVLSKIVD